MIEVFYNDLIDDGYYAFAYDGCHKIYLIKTDDEREQCEELDYDVYDLASLPLAYKDSCPLKFIQDWDTSIEPMVPQAVNEDEVYFAGFPEED